MIELLTIVGRQKNRTNVNVKCPEEYFRIAIAVPIYEDFIQQLKDRFSNHKTVLSSLYLLVPKMCSKISISATDFNLYSNFIDIDSLSVEIKLWNKKWITHPQTDRPSTAVESLSHCNADLFPCRYTFFVKSVSYIASFNSDARVNVFNIQTGKNFFTKRYRRK